MYKDAQTSQAANASADGEAAPNQDTENTQQDDTNEKKKSNEADYEVVDE